MSSKSRTASPKHGVVSASKILGESVVNRDDENLGKIHELVIDARNGRLAYAVLSFGGFLGLGSKLFAVPWGAFEFSNSENKLILNVDTDKLKDAPGFEKDAEWPDFTDRTWGEMVYCHYGYQAYWIADSEPKPSRPRP